MGYIVVKYIRLSIEDAKTESMSIENQHILLDNFIASMDIPDVEVISLVDNGFTGTNFERPAVQELLNLVNSGKVNCIIVKDFSRFGRDAIEVGYFIQRVFPLFQTRFIAVTDGYDSIEHEGDTGGLIVAFKLLLSERYSHDLSKKIKASRTAKALRGEAVYKNCAYGYKKVDGRLEIDEPAAKIVELIFKLASSGNNVTQIIACLYANKVPTPSEYKKRTDGSKCIWNNLVIRAILYDEQYIGTYTAGKSVRHIGKKRCVRVNKSEWITIPNHHPAIVNEALFIAAQERIRYKPEPIRIREVGTSERYKGIVRPLRGKIICACCNHTMVISSTRNATFTCRHTYGIPDAPCHKLRIGNNELTGIFKKIIIKHAENLLNSSNLNNPECNDMEIATLLSEKKKEKQRLFEQLVNDEINNNDYIIAKTQLSDDILRLDQIRISINSGTEKIKPILSIESELKHYIENFNPDDSLSKQIIDLLIDKIFIYPNDKIIVDWKFAEEESILINSMQLVA